MTGVAENAARMRNRRIQSLRNFAPRSPNLSHCKKSARATFAYVEDNGVKIYGRSGDGRRPAGRRPRHHRQMGAPFDELERTPAPLAVWTEKSRRWWNRSWPAKNTRRPFRHPRHQHLRARQHCGPDNARAGGIPTVCLVETGRTPTCCNPMRAVFARAGLRNCQP